MLHDTKMNKEKREDYYKVKRPEIARLISGMPRRILEIGCACGEFFTNITWDCEYHGVEPASNAADESAAKGITVYKGTYEESVNDIPNGYFDLVVANDVIEHMNDPWAFLESIKGKLSDGGRIMGSVPNVRYATNLWNLLIKRDWQYSDAGILDITHLRFFTPRSLSRTLSLAGYTIDYLKPSGPDKYGIAKKSFHRSCSHLDVTFCICK